MFLELSLSSLRIPQLSESLFRRASIELQDISRRNRSRFAQGSESPMFKNRKEELIRRLQNRKITGESFEAATSVVGRERLLLSIYIERYGQIGTRTWLPAFNDEIARSILGNTGIHWHAGRRRQVALFFFKYFDQIPALPFLCGRLIEAHDSAKIKGIEHIRSNYLHCKLIFTPSGHENLVKQSIGSENLDKLMERYDIPENGRFAEKLRQLFLLKAVKDAQLGEAPPVFAEVERLKSDNAPDNLLIGAAALKIIIGRVISEGKGSWIGDWPGWITRLGCDPRYGRSTAEGAKWWGWATDAELRLAQQGMTGLTLKFFIDFLEKSLVGTDKEPQFRMRARFLQAIFKAGKIQDARLVLNNSALQRLDRQHRDPLIVAQLYSTSDQTSMICLRCSDDIFIIEGTHSFGLRMFHRDFPLPGFWEREKAIFHDRQFRISPDACPVFIRHDPSHNWVKKFFNELEYKFHRRWDVGRI